MKKIFTFFLLYLISQNSFSQNNALHFDGIDDYVEIPAADNFLAGNAFTIELWYKPTGTASHPQTLISRKNGAASWMIGSMTGSWDNSDNVFFYFNTGSTEIFTSYSYDFSILNQWHHVAIVYNGATIKLYSDGLPFSQDFYSGNMNVVSGPVWLGNASVPISSGSTALSGAYNGMIDELRIWNTAKTQAEIQADREHEISASATGLAAYYNFNQGTPNNNNTGITSLTDGTATALNGALVNFALTGATSNWSNGFPIAGALPVKLTDFHAIQLNGAIQLQWTTDMEENVQAFEIEKSPVGKHFTRIISISPKGNVNGAQYSYDDKNLADSITYYRLRITDNDGKYEYSKIISVKCPINNDISFFPNPVHNVLHVRTNSLSKSPALILNEQGQVVKTVSSMGQDTFISVDLSSLQRGVYFIRKEGKTESFIKL